MHRYSLLFPSSSAVPTVETMEAVASARLYAAQLEVLLKFTKFYATYYQLVSQKASKQLLSSEVLCLAQNVPQTFWWPWEPTAHRQAL